MMKFAEAVDGKRLLAALSVLFCAFAAFPAFCQGADFTGLWQGTRTEDGDTEDLSVNLTQSGSSVTGTFTTYSDCGLLSNIAISGSTTSSTTANFSGNFYCVNYAVNMTISFANATLSGNTMTGDYSTCSSEYGCNYGTFSLTRLQYLLSVTKSGTGSGAVSSNPSGINSCTGSCSSNFNAGSHVILTATPAFGSVLTSWSLAGCSAPGTCTVTMDAIKNVTATFGPLCAERLVWLGGSSFYLLIQNAYDHITTDGQSIKMQAVDFPEDLLLDDTRAVNLQGGYDCAYSSNTDAWSVVNSMTISGGGITVEQLIVQ
jgi:hypothetical protein